MPIGSSRRRQRCAIWKAWAEAGVRSSSVVMRHPVAKDSAQVTLVDGNHIIQTFSSNRSNQPRTEGVCLRSPDRGPDWRNPEVLDRLVELRRKGGMSIMNEKAIGVVTGNGFAKLLQGPISRGMLGHIAVKNATRSDFDQQQHVEDTKAGGDGDHEITGNDRLRIIVDECLPGLRR